MYYLLSLLLLLIVVLFFTPLFFYTQHSISTIFQFLRLYTPWQNLLFLSFFLLSGLPPVGFFFIKLNFLIYILNYWNIGSIIFYFIFFFINMVFYLNIFKYKIIWQSQAPLIFNKIYITKLYTSQPHNHNIIGGFKRLRYNNTFLHYNILLTYFIFVFFLVLNIFFFTDIFLIIFNLYVW